MNETFELDPINPSEPFAYAKTLGRLEGQLLGLDLKARLLEINLKRELVGIAKSELQSIVEAIGGIQALVKTLGTLTK